LECPATLLIHSEHDVVAPGEPQTDHAFDLILPKLSPSGHCAIYDVERFQAHRSGKGNYLNGNRNMTDYYPLIDKNQR